MKERGKEGKRREVGGRKEGKERERERERDPLGSH